jgi:homoserine dehydrogenase
MKKKLSVGLIGFGTVGTGTYRILTENAGLIAERLGVPVEVKRIAVRDLDRDRGISVPRSMLTTNPMAIVEDPEIDIVAELIGGLQPAKDLILAALARGKHVVTANKALLASDGAEIQAAALQAGLAVGFEGAVGGGIPIIKALGESLAANRILSLYGIINGTTNYILTKMTEEDRTFADVLAEAQRAGYAEADPTFDVGGIDTAHKLTVLVNLSFGASITADDVFTEGIASISPVDIDFGKEFGYRVKLLAIAKARGGSIEARVHPTMVPEDYPIAKVGGVYNAIQIVGDACGDIMLYGRGAGSMPTGSAVVADIMDIGRGILMEPARRLSSRSAPANVRLRSMEEVETVYYVRFMALDRPGVLSQISGVFGRQDISIANVIQRGRKQGGAVPLVIMTHTARERDMRKALAEIRNLATISEEPVLIRVEGGES